MNRARAVRICHSVVLRVGVRSRAALRIKCNKGANRLTLEMHRSVMMDGEYNVSAMRFNLMKQRLLRGVRRYIVKTEKRLDGNDTSYDITCSFERSSTCIYIYYMLYAYCKKNKHVTYMAIHSDAIAYIDSAT